MHKAKHKVLWSAEKLSLDFSWKWKVVAQCSTLNEIVLLNQTKRVQMLSVHPKKKIRTAKATSVSLSLSLSLSLSPLSLSLSLSFCLSVCLTPTHTLVNAHASLRACAALPLHGHNEVLREPAVKKHRVQGPLQGHGRLEAVPRRRHAHASREPSALCRPRQVVRQDDAYWGKRQRNAHCLSRWGCWVSAHEKFGVR